MSGRRIFVTGGGGYLGSALLQALAPRLDAGEIECVMASDVRAVARRGATAGHRIPAA